MTKKNIATLTLPLTNNYGGLLQAYALQQVILSLGHSPKLINIELTNRTNLQKRINYFRQIIRRLVKNTAVFKPDYTSKSHKDYINRNTTKFIDELIEKTNSVKSTFSYDDIEAYNFESFVVGSDQVWRTAYSEYIANYFFEFLEKVPAVKKLSYAASFGVDSWQFTKEETVKCANLIKGFTAISVREDSAVELCKNHLEADAIRVLDPTFLVPTDTYIALVDNANLNKPNGKLFCYILDRSEANQAIEQKAAAFLHTKNFGVMPRKDLENLTPSNIDEFVFPPVEEWLNGFIHADYIITDSFHGTVFAILFNKNFISIGNTKRGLSRFTSILKLFNLEHRLILDAEKFKEEKLVEEINWDEVNKKLEVEKQKSLAFLKQNI